MDLRHLRAAVVLAEELHFGRCAKRLRIAQSAISQTIKALEADVGAELFARTRRSVALTPAGHRFVDGARRILAELEHVSASARSAALGEAGRLAVRFIPMSSLTALPRMAARFQRRYPGVSLSLEPAATDEQLEAIRAGRCDVGFIAMAGAKGDLAPLAHRVVELRPMVALVSRRHRFAGRRSLRLEDLGGEPFVFLAQANEPQIALRFRQRCVEVGFDPRIVLQVEHTDALLAFVAAGFGVSCAPSFIGELRHRGVAMVPLRPTFRAGIVAVWHPMLISAPGRRFLELMPEVMSGSSPRHGDSRAR